MGTASLLLEFMVYVIVKLKYFTSMHHFLLLVMLPAHWEENLRQLFTVVKNKILAVFWFGKFSIALIFALVEIFRNISQTGCFYFFQSTGLDLLESPTAANGFIYTSLPRIADSRRVVIFIVGFLLYCHSNKITVWWSAPKRPWVQRLCWL